MNEKEKIDFYETIIFVKECGIDLCFLYKITNEVYKFNMKKFTRKHCSTIELGQLTHTYIKEERINNIEKKEYFVEYTVGTDSDIRNLLKNKEVVLKIINDTYEVHITKAEQYNINLLNLSKEDLIKDFLKENKHLSDISFVNNTKKTIYDNESYSRFTKIKNYLSK